MSDEQRKDEETEVEGHGFRMGSNAEPASEGEETEVEGHFRHFANDEPNDEAGSDDEVEGHMLRANVRLDTTRKD